MTCIFRIHKEAFLDKKKSAHLLVYDLLQDHALTASAHGAIQQNFWLQNLMSDNY